MKPRLMIVSPVTPYPVFHGAGSAIFGYLRALRPDFDLLFAGFCPKRLLRQAQDGLRLICADVALMEEPERRHLDAFSSTPFYFSNLRDETMRETVRAMYRSGRPDMVQVEYLSMAEYADGMRTTRLIRAHVQEWWHFYLGWKQSLSWGARVTKLLGSCDTILHNRRTLRSFDRVLVTSEEERTRALELVAGARVEALPFLLLDCEQFTADSDIGWLLEHVWPLVLREEPEARLTVVGAGASNALLGRMHDSGVEYRGFVEDLRALYAQSRVYVAPIFTGGGIRTKILEAMAAGVPVVCSRFAPLGIGTREGEHLLASDSPAEFAAHLLRLFRDDGLCRRLRRAARSLIERRYSLQSQGPDVAERYRHFLLEGAA
ncbi:MAG: glycosyltransferase [Acidobacteria bacterium]|nr:glycosyltransferase [Acidobacteriota bacterium]